MATLTRSTKIAFGKVAQTDCQTANTAGQLVTLTKRNVSLADLSLNRESDAGEIGNGTPFASTTFNTSWNGRIPLEKFNTAETLALLAAFALGASTESAVTGAAGVSTYVITPKNYGVNGIDLPSLTYVEQNGTAFDRAAIGAIVSSFQLSIQSGPGRASSSLTAQMDSTGKLLDPSNLTLPSVLLENTLSNSGASVTVNGTDYVAAKSMLSCSAGWNNNPSLDDGFFIGSGVQDSADPGSGAIRGRMEVGQEPQANLSFVARFDSGSPELTKLKTGATGTATIALKGAQVPGAAANTPYLFQMLFHRVQYETAVLGDQNGKVTVAVTARPLINSSGNYLTITARCALVGISV